MSTDHRSQRSGRPPKRQTHSLVRLEYSDEQRVFMLAMDRYKRENHRPHPTWREVLMVAKSLGYRIMEPMPC